jgi:hypothetical protein
VSRYHRPLFLPQARIVADSRCAKRNSTSEQLRTLAPVITTARHKAVANWGRSFNRHLPILIASRHDEFQAFSVRRLPTWPWDRSAVQRFSHSTARDPDYCVSSAYEVRASPAQTFGRSRSPHSLLETKARVPRMGKGGRLFFRGWQRTAVVTGPARGDAPHGQIAPWTLGHLTGCIPCQGRGHEALGLGDLGATRSEATAPHAQR